MERCPTIGEFVREPIGRWVASSPTIVTWCWSPALCGAIVWGRPTTDDTRAMLDAFGAYRHPRMGEPFDVVLDGSRIEGVDPDGLTMLFSWLSERRAELATRVRMQYSVRHEGIPGLTLTGILPVLGETHRFALVDDRRTVLATLAPDADSLPVELDAAEAAVLNAPQRLDRLRSFLTARRGAASLADAARTLSVSERALQRLLQEAGTSFRDELRTAKYAAAKALLVQGDEKISFVARPIGISEGALTALVRDVAGCTPAELRKRHR